MNPRPVRGKPSAESARVSAPARIPPVEPDQSAAHTKPVKPVDQGESAPPDESAASAAPIVQAGPATEATPLELPAVHFRVSRFKKGDRKGHFDDFDLTVEPATTVLDALLRIRRRHDPSLVFRHSCMHASCGTCGVRVNGREVLGCDTKIANLPVEKPIKVEPLANQRPVADLATDMVDFYARFDAVGMPLTRAAEVGGDSAPPESIKMFERFENCIECGLCLSACPIARMNRSYIGPAALAAAARVVEEPRGRELGPVLALAAEPNSVWGCHDALECTSVCPSAVDPAMAILGMRRHIAVDRVKRLFGADPSSVRR
jgi:succinate dehydrogenase / fumarate reductase iron-sulfur subunit